MTHTSIKHVSRVKDSGNTPPDVTGKLDIMFILTMAHALMKEHPSNNGTCSNEGAPL